MPTGIYTRTDRNKHTPEAKAKRSAAMMGNKRALGKKRPPRSFLNVSKGYAFANFMGTWIAAHRLAYVFYHGPIPAGHLVHHDNADKLDNREENLKAMTRPTHVSLHWSER